MLRNRITLCLVAASLNFAMGASPSFAQSTQEKTQKNNNTYKEADIEKLTVYGLGFESEGILALSEGEVDTLMATTADELFRSIPNVEALQGPGRQFFDFNLRGSEGAGSVIVTVDGAEKNLVTTKHGTTFNPVFLVPEFMKSVSIIRGPVSNTFGTGSTGGRVQLETVDPFDYVTAEDAFGGEVRVNGESNGDGRLFTGIVAGSVSDNMGILAAFSDRSFESYDDGDGNEVLNSGSDSENYLTKVQWDVSENLQVEGGVSKSNIEYLGSNIFARSNERQDADFFNEVEDTGANISIDYKPSSDTQYFANAFISKTDHEETLLEGRRGANGEPGELDTREVETKGGQAYASKRFIMNDIIFDVTAGVSGSTDELSFVGGSDVGGKRSNYGAFAHSRIQFTENFNLVPGIRFERYTIDTDIGTNNDGSEWLPKLTANYSVLPGVSFYATYAKGLRTPTLNQLLLGNTQETSRRGSTTITTTLPNEDLGPQFSDTYDVGIRFNKKLDTKSHLYGSIGVFKNESTERIEQVVLESETVGDTTTLVRQNQNVGESQVRGVEASLEYTYASTFIGATYARSIGERLDTGEDLNSVRPDRGTLYIGWAGFDDTLTLRAELEVLGSKDEVGENQNVTGDDSEAAQVMNLFGAYQINEKLFLRARINNITDEAYRRFDQIDNSIGRNARLEMALAF
jgi:hemoglobin/transferrin/lactoferrin receptor protein